MQIAVISPLFLFSLAKKSTSALEVLFFAFLLCSVLSPLSGGHTIVVDKHPVEAA